MTSRHAVLAAALLPLALALAAPAAAQTAGQPEAGNEAAAAPQTAVVVPAQTEAADAPAGQTQPTAAPAGQPQTAPVQISVNPPQQAPGTAPVPPRPLPERPASPTVVLVLIGLLGVVGIAFLLMIRTALGAKGSGWSLAQALSESEPAPFLDPSGNPVRENGDSGPLLLTPKLQPSTSRLIALMGLFGILLLYLGFGAVILYYFGTGQNLPAGIDEVQSFLLAGLTLFAPYVVNKFADVFKSFARR